MNSRSIFKLLTSVLAILLSTQAPLAAQSMKFARVLSKRVARTTELPGEFYPYETVQLHAKVESYVESVSVDRGSTVKRGDLLIQLSAP
jgi:membrane fusion protein, multidrug efflux system